ncbi:MAG: Na+/H+ antiporter NhaA [Bacteroidetes bacterium]|nr:Na+/H+ antiporter NhaA [Bacteroidota bacterium]
MTVSSRHSSSVFTAFFRSEATGGIVLIVTTIVSLVLANSPLADHFTSIITQPVLLEHNGHTLTILDWINDGLMSLFFLGVGMEIRRELTRGELSTPTARRLPVIAAIGGMAAPALIYLAVAGNGVAARGWAIPSATDIAFSLGVLSLLGDRITRSVRIFVAALAIIDDLGAVVIIALFYGGSLSLPYLVASVVLILLIWGIAHRGTATLWLILFTGVVLWYLLLQSGIHPTLAGVMTGLLLPASQIQEQFERRLNPIIAFGIVPLFALVNAAVPIHGNSMIETITTGAGLGVLLGLIVGKPVGITVAALLARGRSAGSSIPIKQLVGAAMLCGIGFTMSLFITQLAFTAPNLIDQAKLAILCGSLLSGIIGYAYLRVFGSTEV